jgi:hypothetical protein
MANQRMKEYQISSFADIVQALRENPKWLKELRRMILTQELLRLPTKLAEFRDEIKESLASLQDSRLLKGLCLEMRVLDNVSSFFSEHLLDAKVVGQEEIKQSLSVAMEKGVISKEEMEELCRLDLIVEGTLPSTNEPKLKPTIRPPDRENFIVSFSQQYIHNYIKSISFNNTIIS